MPKSADEERTMPNARRSLDRTQDSGRDRAMASRCDDPRWAESGDDRVSKTYARTADRCTPHNRDGLKAGVSALFDKGVPRAVCADMKRERTMDWREAVREGAYPIAFAAKADRFQHHTCVLLVSENGNVSPCPCAYHAL